MPQIQTYQVILPLNSRRSAPDLETAKPPAIVSLDELQRTDSELVDGLMDNEEDNDRITR
jgi:hypothetical protein